MLTYNSQNETLELNLKINSAIEKAKVTVKHETQSGRVSNNITETIMSETIKKSQILSDA